MLKKLLTILLLSGCASLCAADPSEQFLSAYQAYQQGEKSERDGSNAEALRKYRFAESILVEITTKDPAWQKAVIEYRLKKTRDGITRLQGASDSVSLTGASDLPNGSSPEATSQQQGPSITVVPPNSGSGAQSAQQRLSSDSSAEVRRLKKQLETLKADLQEAREALTSQKTRSKDLDSAKWVEERSMLEKELQTTKDKVAQLGEQLRKRDSWEKDLKDLQRKLNDAVADKTATEELYQQREKKTAEATAELTRQLEEARQKVAQSGGSQQKIEELSKEVEKGRESVKQLQSKMEHAEEFAKESLANNTKLKEQLADVSQKLADSQRQAGELEPLRLKVKGLLEESKKSAEAVALLKSESEKSRGEAAKKETTLRADLQAVEEERQRIADCVAQLGDAAREASKVKVLEAESGELKQSLARLQEQLSSAQKDLVQAKTQADSSEQSAKAAAEKLAANISAQEADRAALEEEQQKLSAKLEQASASLAELGKKAAALDPLTKQVEQLQGQLAENGKALDLTKAKLEETARAATGQKEESDRKFLASQKLKEQLEQQNSSLEGQLKGAMDRMKSLVEGAQNPGILQEQFKSLQQQLDANVKSQEEARQKINAMTSEKAAREKAIKDQEKTLADSKNEAEKLRSDLTLANQKIVALQQQTAQGDDRLKKLQDQLAEVSKNRSPDKPPADLLAEVERLKSELAASSQKVASMQGNAATIKELGDKLAEKESQVARLSKKKGAVGADTSQENALLRGIVIRQVKEEARRAQARRLMEEEMKRLNVQSQSLTEQITVLSAPSINLTPEERALFKEGQLLITDDDGGKLQASVAAPIGNPAADGSVRKDAEPQTQAKKDSPDASQAKELPWQGKFKESIARAKEAFDRQDFIKAESSFKEALTYAPDDYFALSNLGVVEFQLGKLPEAEDLLLKASQKSKDNSFALTTLGIVHYRQERLPDAENVLRKAIAINPQDFTAHNYLGIVLAATGKGSAGESEIMKALEINPQYADAHFNLAVIYATGKPPAKMMARKHYTKAVELGAPPDESLARLVQ